MTDDPRHSMTPAQYRAGLKRLRFVDPAKPGDEGISAGGRFFGASPRAGQNWAAEGPPAAVALLMRSLLAEVDSLKALRKKNLDMLKSLERTTMRSNGKDTTAAWRKTVEGYLADVEDLLRRHPSGLPSQID